MIVGASLAGWLGILVVTAIVRNTRIKEDAALGIILAVFFGVGIVLLTLIQKMPNANQAGLDKFLFGQAAALLERDIKTMGVISIMVISLTLLFWKEFKLLCFDPTFGASLGFPMKILDILLMTLIVIAIVIGLQAVGVVLMSAMVVAPASAARQWTNRLAIMVCLAAFFGAIAGVTGAIISSTTTRIPTGPMIVVCASVIFLFSLAFAPNRGLVWQSLLKKTKFKPEINEVDPR
jgi:manganese/zinc/iron transport system permease protein